MLTRTRSLRCSGSPHRAGRGGGWLVPFRSVGADVPVRPLVKAPMTAREAAAEREAEAMRQPPQRPPHHPPRDSSCKFAEDPSVPEGRAKSEQAPIRRPRQRGGPLHRSAPKRFFSLDRAIAQPLAAFPLMDAAYPLRVRPVSLLAIPKEKRGGIPLDKPPAGANPLEADLWRPIQSYSLEIPNPTVPATK